ncbi:MAG: LysR family transcriptional regulator [Clostridia bacterium]|nr:LysR family transcriptional regulator [Clostridia bacterium]
MFTNKHYILTIYEEGGFSKAAKQLYISQPSLSASVKRIEDKLSVPLFDRSTSPISLTEAGQEYIRYALEIRQKEQDFERYLSDYANMIKGPIKIGGSSLFSSFMLPKMIYEFNSAYPLVNFKIVEDNTKNLIEKLSLGVLDIIIDNAIINEDTIRSTVCTNETLLLAVPHTLPVNEKLKNFRLTTNDIKDGRHLSNEYDVSLKHFSDCNFILLNTENDTGSRANILFKKYGFNPKVTLFLDQQVTSYNISCTGMGISFVSDTLIKHTEFEPRLYFYKLLDEETTRKIYFYTKSNHYLSRACQKFIDSNSKK